MKITTEAGYRDGWICLCGNRPTDDGFYPCDREGNMVEPTPKAWTTNWYVCDRCGRIVDQDSLEVVGFRDGNKLSLQERKEIAQAEDEKKGGERI